MGCEHCQEAILDSFDERLPVSLAEAVEAHMAACVGCAEFAARQRAIDRGLARSFIAGPPSARVREAVRRRIRDDRTRVWSGWVLDAVHFGSCAAVTGLCAILMPDDAPLVLGLGAVAATLTHMVLAAAQNSLDAADDAG